MKPTRHFFILLLMLISLTFYGQHSLSNNQETSSFIEALQNGESYTIEITSVGCFHGTRQTVIISKEADVFTAQLGENTINLTSSDIDTLKRFEIELRAVQIGGCTTVDTYVLSYQGQTFRTSDGTCSWFGYREIMKLFA